jgi:hypothetical protein
VVSAGTEKTSTEPPGETGRRDQLARRQREPYGVSWRAV